MTEITHRSDAMLEAEELDELRAKVRELEARDALAEPTISTRDRSPVKPQDRKPADTDTVKLTFYGVDVEIQRRMYKDWRMVRMIGRTQNGDMSAAGDILDFLLGAEAHDQIVENIIEEDGWCDSDKFQDITKELFEALDAGN
jgi:hypothetical protein